MYYIPILGALALASGTIFEKVVLKKKKISVKLYQAVSFFFISLVMLPFLWFFWKLDSQAFELTNILIFSLVVIFSIIANLLVFYSMKWEKINNLEPAKVLEPLFVILLATTLSFFFNIYERDLKIIVLALIAASALLFSHIKKHHLTFNKYFIAAIFGSLFFATELVISRLILDFYSPITFYFLRCSSIFILSLIFFRPKFEKLDRKSGIYIFVTAFIWFAYRIIVYYGYLELGVIFTTLMLMLGPIFIYLFARIFLKEKLNWKNISASIIIIVCVLYGTLF